MGDSVITCCKLGRDPRQVDRTGWKRLKVMTDKQVEASAASDPDNLPLTKEQLAKRGLRRPGRSRIAIPCRLTQEQFARASIL